MEGKKKSLWEEMKKAGKTKKEKYPLGKCSQSMLTHGRPLWYNNRRTVIIPDFAAVFSSRKRDNRKHGHSTTSLSLCGIISTVAAHVRQDTAYSVVLFTKRLLLMLHHSQNRQSRFYAALAACKSAWTCSYGIMETIISPRRNWAEGPDSRKGEMVYEDEKTGAHRPDGH